MGTDRRYKAGPFDPFPLRIAKPQIVPGFVLHSRSMPFLAGARYLRHLPPKDAPPVSRAALMPGLRAQEEQLRR